MATTKARVAEIPIPRLWDADDSINSAIETLETAGFVAQTINFERRLNDIGEEQSVAIIHSIHEDYVPGGATDPLHHWPQYSVGYLRFSGVSSDAETVTVQGRVYEFDTGGAVAPGSVLVDISGGASAAQSVAAFVAAVNADSGASVEALADSAGTSAILIGKAATTAFTLATTCANGVVSGAAMADGRAQADRYFSFSQHPLTAADITALAAGNEVPVCGMDDPGSTPVLRYVQVMSSAGSFYSMAGLTARVARINANNYAILLSDPLALALLSATDVVRSEMIA